MCNCSTPDDSRQPSKLPAKPLAEMASWAFLAWTAAVPQGSIYIQPCGCPRARTKTASSVNRLGAHGHYSRQLADLPMWKEWKFRLISAMMFTIRK
jgi:hypothetical protein